MIEDYGGHVRNGVLDRIGPLDPLLAEKIGEAGDCGQRSHREADDKEDAGCRCPRMIVSLQIATVRDEG